MSKVLKRIGERHKNSENYYCTIIEYYSFRNCTIQLEDGNILTNIEYGNLKKGNVKNPFHPSVCGVGYVGQGKYKVKVKGVLSPIYEVWRGIIRRCYSIENQKKHPTYKDCTVDERWHNYQIFAKWYEDNHVEGFHLDKDILVKGNKIYSPETCCFVPRDINNLFIKAQNKRGKYPIGVHINKNTNKYIALVGRGFGQEWIGAYDTPEEAFQAYKVAKEAYIKEVADKWQHLITPQTYQALINYTVEIAD